MKRKANTPTKKDNKQKDNGKGTEKAKRKEPKETRKRLREEEEGRTEKEKEAPARLQGGEGEGEGYDWRPKNFVRYRESEEWGEWPWKVEVDAERTTVVYFKSDLRVHDNPALARAAHHAKDTGGRLVGLFVFCLEELKRHQYADCKIWLIHDALASLRARLQALLAAPLVVLLESRPEAVPYAVREFCQQVRCEGLFYNRQYEWDEAHRDALTEQLLHRLSIPCHSSEDQLILPAGSLKTTDGRDYTVFTPFKAAWLKRVESSPSVYLCAADAVGAGLPLGGCEFLECRGVASVGSVLSSLDRSVYDLGNWSRTESEVMEIAEGFIEMRAKEYHKSRDFPDIDGTSKLSPYLAIGMISPKYLISKAKSVNNGKLSSGSPGIISWITEIIWREFFRNILVAFPTVAKGKPFKEQTAALSWSTDRAAFERWCRGETGFPLVDAGMRQLNATGWMHNRARMVAAMFLTKDLMIDWRWGEEYFMGRLIDGDFASNNGGWQWSASTGTDAQPYFRVFNPVLQSEKFDKEGRYIRRWVPELASVRDAKVIHDPYHNMSRKDFDKLGYHPPICDHAVARGKAIQMFKSVLGK
eukprot:TRINITY_DN5465_c0_g1_i1.p1 TRINITY_DN5465_c0_g1~~TRINITY_DN5465_c0_g1_i1.p1  ORF type:complete len:586 (-),score=74.96 TRINITY_DN5465_c0_g1_i1:33-1790(-)